MIFKFRHMLLGGHVHVQVFAGNNPDALGKCGDLIFREEEWDEFRKRGRAHFQFVDDTEPEDRDD